MRSGGDFDIVALVFGSLTNAVSSLFLLFPLKCCIMVSKTHQANNTNEDENAIGHDRFTVCNVYFCNSTLSNTDFLLAFVFLISLRSLENKTHDIFVEITNPSEFICWQICDLCL